MGTALAVDDLNWATLNATFLHSFLEMSPSFLTDCGALIDSSLCASCSSAAYESRRRFSHFRIISNNCTDLGSNQLQRCGRGSWLADFQEQDYSRRCDWRKKKSPWELNSRVKSFIRMKYLVSQQQLCLMKQVPPFCRISLKGKFNITLVCVCVCSLCGTTGLLFFSFFCTSKDQNLLNWLQKWNIYEVF